MTLEGLHVQDGAHGDRGNATYGVVCRGVTRSDYKGRLILTEQPAHRYKGVGVNALAIFDGQPVVVADNIYPLHQY